MHRRAWQHGAMGLLGLGTVLLLAMDWSAVPVVAPELPAIRMLQQPQPQSQPQQSSWPLNGSAWRQQRRRATTEDGDLKETQAWLLGLREAIGKRQTEVEKDYGMNRKRLTDHKFYDSKQGPDKIIQRLLRALVLGDSFVYVVGGMSDTAAHGNYFEDSYPLVMKQMLQEYFSQARIKFDVRNMAMGGVPSYPGSMCMADVFGRDADVVMWDYRMVEHDAAKGELFIRQAMLHPRTPAVAFKRANGYLNTMSNYYSAVSLHAIDERGLLKYQASLKDPRALNMVLNDSFCSPQANQPPDAECPCPGKVRWHSQHKQHRIRGVHMAMWLLWLLDEAAKRYLAMLQDGQTPTQIKAQDWSLPTPPTPEQMPPPYDKKECKEIFCSHAYSCATTWTPTQPPALPSFLDSESKWAIDHPSGRAKSITELGHKACHYVDSKLAFTGKVDDGWLFFKFQGTSGGTVAFCASYPAESKWQDEILVLLNGEEIQGEMVGWMRADTLGVNLGCFSHSGAVTPGENVLGFRVMKPTMTLQLSHVLWK